MNCLVLPLPALRNLHSKAMKNAETVAKTDVTRAADCKRVAEAYAAAIKVVERDAAMINLGINPLS
jgi:hypothetical protein